jgi:hypothetical protein
MCAVACVATPGAPLPGELSFDCSEHIYAGFLNQTLDRPINTK